MVDVKRTTITIDPSGGPVSIQMKAGGGTHMLAFYLFHADAFDTNYEGYGKAFRRGATSGTETVALEEVAADLLGDHLYVVLNAGSLVDGAVEHTLHVRLLQDTKEVPGSKFEVKVGKEDRDSADVHFEYTFNR